jgi:putative transposase
MVVVRFLAIDDVHRNLLEIRSCKMNFRRKRLKHFDIAGDAHFITFSCFGRMPLLSKDRTRIWLVEAIENARIRHEFDLWGWVFMPEHVHLMIYPRNPIYRIDKILASIKKPVGYRAIQFLEQVSPDFLKRLTVVYRDRTYRRFWQAGGGYDSNMDDLRAIHEAIEYMHQNPVRRGLVERDTDWLWSSARDWAGMKHPLMTVDRTLPPLFY